ncbi:MAG: AI-2E family transporter [Candidatus Pacebacteria bacterium]|nr:AI-2E family transporter [Candidatus Paceibacterota bacterium]
MHHDHHSNYFLLFCLIASLVVVYFILQPFLAPLILAAVFAYLFQPVQQRLTRAFGGRTSLAAFATTLLAVVILLLPIGLLGAQIFKETTHLYASLAGAGGGGFIAFVESTVASVRTVLPIPAGVDLSVGQYATQALGVLAANLGPIFSSLAGILLSLFVFLTAFYFLLKDGARLKEYLVKTSPLADRDDEMIVSRLQSAVSASVKGSLTIGLVQGVLVGIGFAIFGVPNAALWGAVAAIAALVPAVGTALVIAPAVLFLFLTGSTFGAAGLLVWGLTTVGLVDNLLGPRLIGRGMQLHPLVVFLAVLGGLSFFGPLGFFLGPLVVSLCLALIEIYSSLKARETHVA